MFSSGVAFKLRNIDATSVFLGSEFMFYVLPQVELMCVQSDSQ